MRGDGVALADRRHHSRVQTNLYTETIWGHTNTNTHTSYVHTHTMTTCLPSRLAGVSGGIIGEIQLRVPLEHYNPLLSEDILYQWSCITTNNALPGKMPVSLIAINHACACSCFCYASDTATHHSTYRGAVSSL